MHATGIRSMRLEEFGAYPTGMFENNSTHRHQEPDMGVSFYPQILMFACNWCAYSAADLAGVSRMQYPSNVRLIHIMCTGRMNPNFILKAFDLGADGVLVSG